MENFALTEAVYYILLSLEKPPCTATGSCRIPKKLSGGRLHLAAERCTARLPPCWSGTGSRRWAARRAAAKSEYRITPLGAAGGARRDGLGLRELLQNGGNDHKGVGRMTKTIYKLFGVWDYDKEEEWLNKMAAMGLAMTGVGFKQICLSGRERPANMFTGCNCWKTAP